MEKLKKSLMVQGTASDVGKSILVTALCRIFSQDGYDINPFKSQNMSLNSYITPDGFEMGRAQVMQAEASYKVPNVRMNPLLLKPTDDRKAQVVFNGKVHSNMDAVDYFDWKVGMKEEISKIYNDLESLSDIVVIEGAGSPAEINLVENDFVNMGMADIADAPVILVADIDRGGVFAAIAGTLLLLPKNHKDRVKGVIINKFRGSIELLMPGIKQIEEITGVPVLGVIPYFHLNLEDEDGISKWMLEKTLTKDIDIAIIKNPYMSNHTDFNSLRLHNDVSVRFVGLSEEIGNPDMIILPGTKSTIADMEALNKSGMADKIMFEQKKGTRIFGICGGFQMMGKEIFDPKKIETEKERTEGLGIFDAITTFYETKKTTLSSGKENIFGTNVRGYEIHMGVTAQNVGGDAMTFIESEGLVSKNRRALGTYLHGIFDSSKFTNRLLNEIRLEKGLKIVTDEESPMDFWEFKESQYDELATIIRKNLDIEKIYKIIGI